MNEGEGGRPERIEAELRLSCDERNILESEFRIHAFIKDSKGRGSRVGYALVGPNKQSSPPEFLLANLHVDSGYRGRGIGSQIMDRFESIILQHSGKGILGDAIEKGSKAEGMYQQRGWREENGRLVFP